MIAESCGCSKMFFSEAAENVVTPVWVFVVVEVSVRPSDLHDSPLTPACSCNGRRQVCSYSNSLLNISYQQ